MTTSKESKQEIPPEAPKSGSGETSVTTFEEPKKTRKPKKKPVNLIEKLSAEFDESIIKKRQLMRANGDIIELDYIPGRYIIERLNEIFGLNWSFEIKDKYVDTQIMHVTVLGKLTVKENNVVVKIAEQYGGTYISRNIKGNVVSLGDDMKIATTDAMKKCATQLGVALYLYDNDDTVQVLSNAFATEPVDKENLNEMRDAVAPADKSDVKPSPGQTNIKTENDGLATPMQVNAIKRICESKQIEENKLRTLLGCGNFEALSYNDAASIITMKHKVWNNIIGE